jgi:hypothetical protein
MAAINPIFDIGNTRDTDSGVLLCEWGEAHCCIALLNESSKTLACLRYFSVEWNDEAAVENVLHILADLAASATRVVICSAFPQAVLVPGKMFSEEKDFISSLWGNRYTPQLADPINEWQVVNAFALPAPLYEKINGRFPGAAITHVYSPELKIYNGFVAEHQMVIHFSPNYFRVIVKRSGQLQLAQIYFYNAPLDVVYYLLKIVEELNLDKDDTYLIVSGLIEESSALYKDIESYFANVHFATPFPVTLPGNVHPQHFFTSMYKLAACVS